MPTRLPGAPAVKVVERGSAGGIPLRQTGTMFGDLFQLGHVVPDLGPAMAAWEAAGVGPFQVVEDFPVAEWRSPAGVVEIHVDVALAWSGAIQVELIEPHGDPCMYTEFLAACPAGGLQHFGRRVDDYGASRATALGAGWRMWLEGTLTDGREFCYLRPPAALVGALPVEIAAPRI